MQRPIETCRSWLFVEGANEAALASAPASGADVLIHELEDFTPPELLPKARALAGETYAGWRAARTVVAVRINPLDAGGLDDLNAVMAARPHIVALPKVAGPGCIAALDAAVTRCETEHNIAPGTTRLLPNIESAAALVRTGEIARASSRVAACLLASEDLAADIGAERLPGSAGLSYARQRFLIECVAAGVPAVDCPYTWSDVKGLRRDAAFARRHGFKAKSAVAHAHAAEINHALTPSATEIASAKALVAAFNSARAQGHARARHNGALIEPPMAAAAERLLARARQLAKAGALSPAKPN